MAAPTSTITLTPVPTGVFQSTEPPMAAPTVDRSP